MSDEQACKSEDQHRIDTLEELTNAERELRSAKTRFEQAQWEVVKAAESLLELRDNWSRLRKAALSCYPAAVPVERVLEEAQATIDRFCAEVNARNADLDKAISALTPEDKGGLLDPVPSPPDESSPQASETDAEGWEPIAPHVERMVIKRDTEFKCSDGKIRQRRVDGEIGFLEVEMEAYSVFGNDKSFSYRFTHCRDWQPQLEWAPYYGLTPPTHYGYRLETRIGADGQNEYRYVPTDQFIPHQPDEVSLAGMTRDEIDDLFEGSGLKLAAPSVLPVSDDALIPPPGAEQESRDTLPPLAGHNTWYDAYGRVVKAPAKASTDAERTSVVTDHDRVDQTNTDTVAAVEIPEGEKAKWQFDKPDWVGDKGDLYGGAGPMWEFDGEDWKIVQLPIDTSEPAEAGEDDEPKEEISVLTGDPAIEPESGLHDEQSQSDPITNSEASFWTAGFEEDRKPKPGFIEGAVSKLFGAKEPA